jgi:hypothetical protein
MSAPSTRLGTPQGPGSVSGAPQLPAGVTDTITSRYLDPGQLRMVMPALARGPPGCSHRRRPG